MDYLYPENMSADEQYERRKAVAVKLRKVAEGVWSWGGICKKIAEL